MCSLETVVTNWIVVTLCALSTIAAGPVTHKIGGNAPALVEFCNMETFRPQCRHNEVVIIGKAYYGRRHTGRCLNVEDPNLVVNPRYLGCSADVTEIVALKCSGKKQCELRIPDSDLEQTKPCLNDLKLFLEVSYTCVEVVEERSCVISLSSNPLHITRNINSSWSAINCGVKTQPWLLEAPSGQRINISLLDFTPSVAASSAGLMSDSKSSELIRTSQTKSGNTVSHSISSSNMFSCQYGYVIDRSAANRRNVSMCGSSSSQQLTNVYTSSSNMVELVLPPNQQLSFLLRMQAVGCTDLVPAEDTWVQRDDNRMIVGCFTSRQTWQLRCQEGKWVGVMSNCTQHQSAVILTPDAVLQQESSSSILKNYEVATVVAICFACVFLSLLIISGGAICWYRFYANLSAGSLGVYRFKYRCVGLPKGGGYSPRDIEMSMVGGDAAVNRYENLIYGSTMDPAAVNPPTKLTPVMSCRLFNKTSASPAVAGS